MSKILTKLGGLLFVVMAIIATCISLGFMPIPWFESLPSSVQITIIVVVFMFIFLVPATSFLSFKNIFSVFRSKNK